MRTKGKPVNGLIKFVRTWEFLCISKTLGNALSSIENLSKALRPSGNLHEMLDPNEKMGEGFRSQ